MFQSTCQQPNRYKDPHGGQPSLTKWPRWWLRRILMSWMSIDRLNGPHGHWLDDDWILTRLDQVIWMLKEMILATWIHVDRQNDQLGDWPSLTRGFWCRSIPSSSQSCINQKYLFYVCFLFCCSSISFYIFLHWLTISCKRWIFLEDMIIFLIPKPWSIWIIFQQVINSGFQDSFLEPKLIGNICISESTGSFP